jgi:hypothetical protein
MGFPLVGKGSARRFLSGVGRSVGCMTIDTTVARHPVVAALARVDEAIDETTESGVWSMPDEDLLAALADTERLAARLAGLQLRLVAEADGRGLPARHGAPGTGALLRHRLRVHPKEANARVRLAGDPDLAATRAALCDGAISLGHARVVQQAVSDLPGHVRSDAQAFLVREATVFDPGQLGKLARHLRHVVDPAGTERAERAAAGKRELSIFDRGDGTHGLRGVLDHEAAAALLAALDPLAAPRPAADGTPDPRTPRQRYADALMTIIGWTLDDGTLLPGARGARPHVHVTAGLDTLKNHPGAPAADLTWGGPISAETLRRIACDADLTVLLLDQHGVPLHVGREHRTVTPGIWAALVARDRGCSFPSCTRPPGWCQAHHARHWSDGGETALTNLVLLCGHHHRTVHHDGWHVRLAEDRHPEYIPPRWVDPHQQPQRNTFWRIRDRIPPPDGAR